MSAVLIVDDDRISRMFTEVIVRKAGASILTAENGFMAVETVKSGHEIDIIVMDMSMPVMDGFEATKIIKEYKKEIPVIALTSLNQDGQKKRMKDAGCDMIMNKPVNAELLHRVIRERIENTGTEFPA